LTNVGQVWSIVCGDRRLNLSIRTVSRQAQARVSRERHVRHLFLEFKAPHGFAVPIEASSTLTGHIDVLQVSHGAIHILDYKPRAKSEKPIPQLIVYALALSRRTGFRLFDFVCAWFDEHHYCEFYPLHVIHKCPRS
jgi:ATP-dependent exoDNAse (exonuclease V) beta subunit